MMTMFAVVMALVITTSCKQKSDDPVEVVKALVEDAKANGANWSVDEWKDAYKQAMEAVKPTFVEMNALYENIGDMSEEQMTEMMKKAEELETKTKPLFEALEQFTDAAKSCPNGLAVENDQEWQKQVADELGLPDL